MLYLKTTIVFGMQQKFLFTLPISSYRILRLKGQGLIKIICTASSKIFLSETDFFLNCKCVAMKYSLVLLLILTKAQQFSPPMCFLN